MNIKSIVINLLFIITTTFSSAQIRSINPAIAIFPELHPDSILKAESQSRHCMEIHNGDTPYDSLNDDDKYIYDNAWWLLREPYSTAIEGCSWYCATGPSHIESTSELDSNKGLIYSADVIHDFDIRTAWIEGIKGDGIGETIHFDFELAGQLKLTTLEIYNGYCKDLATWKNNSRVKTFALYVNGKITAHLKLKDTYKCQIFDIGSYGGNKYGKLRISLKILEVYKGDKYTDTGISEINFDGTGDH